MCDRLPGFRCHDEACKMLERAEAIYQRAFGGPEVTPVSNATLPRSVLLANDKAQSLVDMVRHERDLRRQINENNANLRALNSQVEATFARAAHDANRAGQALERALARMEVLYQQSGARYGHHYINDIREAYGIAAHEDLSAEDFRGPNRHKLTAALHCREPKMKVKRNGPDAAPTREAARLAKEDEQLASALAEFHEAREALAASAGEHQATVDQALEASRTAISLSTQHKHAQSRVRQAWADLERIDAGVHPDATRVEAARLRDDQVVVYPDGSTNLWVETGGDEPRFEKVTGVKQAALDGIGARQVLVTSSGVQVLGSVRHANYTTTTSGPTVWVDPPRDQGRPARAAYPKLALVSELDTGD